MARGSGISDGQHAGGDGLYLETRRVAARVGAVGFLAGAASGAEPHSRTMRVRLFVRVVLLSSCLSMAACASSGKKFDTTHVNDIHTGEHDKSAVLAWFGEPSSKTAVVGSPKAVERWIYTYARAVGFGHVTQAQTLVVDFDAQGKVCDHAYVKQK
jgi:outer membrane protein assembly factor BamE (lipoprotein component of BamABCDE complex)